LTKCANGRVLGNCENALKFYWHFYDIDFVDQKVRQKADMRVLFFKLQHNDRQRNNFAKKRHHSWE